MIRFNNDYNHGAHPEILEALGAINGNSYGGYGEDYLHRTILEQDILSVKF